ncbi:MAG: DUF4352 domain-containing protein [Thermoplasmatales archaeon]|nr:DUF4352 domain-containing protein [Thermoplasmatales archaeon]
MNKKEKIIIAISIIIGLLFTITFISLLNYPSEKKSENKNVILWDYEIEYKNKIGAYSKPQEGYIYAVVTIRIVNNHNKESISTNAWNWYLYVDNIRYAHHSVTYADEIGHQAVDVLPGGDFTTKIVFEVPYDTLYTTNIYLKYEEYIYFTDMVIDEGLLPP